MSDFLKKHEIQVISAVVLIVAAFIGRGKVLNDDAFGKVFASFLAQLPFSKTMVSAYETATGFAKEVADLSTIRVAEDLIKLLLMVLLQRVVNKFATAIFLPLPTAKKTIPWAVSLSEEIDMQQEYMETAAYKRKDAFLKAVCALIVTLLVTFLFSRYNSMISKASGWIKILTSFLIVALLFLISFYVLIRKNLIRPGVALAYRCLSIIAKCGLRYFANMFLLRTCIEFVTRDFSKEIFVDSMIVLLTVVGWFIFTVLENDLPGLIAKKLPWIPQKF